MEGLKDGEYALILIAVPCWLIGGCLRAIRWRMLLDYDGKTGISLLFAMRVIYGAFFMEIIGPKVTSDLYRGTLLWTASDKQIKFSRSFGVIIFERFLDFFLKLLIAIIGIILLGQTVSEIGEGSTTVIIFSLFLFCGFVIFFALLSREDVAVAISEKWIKTTGPKKDSLAGKIDPSEFSRIANTFVSLAKSKSHLARSGLLTLATFIVDLFVWILLFASVDVKPDVFMLAFIMAVVALAIFVSMFPGGYGVREIAGTVALIWAGVEPEIALTALIVLRLFNLLMNIMFGGSFFVLTSALLKEKEGLQNPKN